MSLTKNQLIILFARLFLVNIVQFEDVSVAISQAINLINQ